MVCQSARGRCRLMREKLEKSESFIIDEWEASTVGLPFLDTFVYVDPNTRKLQTRVHWKPSSLGVPLHYDSLHASHIHMAWIMSEIRRIAICSSNHADFLLGRSELVSRLRTLYISLPLVERAANYDPYLGNLMGVSRGSTRRNCAWVVVPYHPAWSAPLFSQALRACTSLRWWQSFLENEWPDSRFKSLRLSWKNCGRRIVQRVGYASHTEL